jgi:hypothetical protein
MIRFQQQHKASDPVHISLLGSDAVVLPPVPIPNLVQQTGLSSHPYRPPKVYLPLGFRGYYTWPNCLTLGAGLSYSDLLYGLVAQKKSTLLGGLLWLGLQDTFMRHDAKITSQDSEGMKGKYPCPECRRETNHSVLSIVNSNHFDETGLVQFWDHYLTVRCDGCGTVSFCHVAKCSENEDYTEHGMPILVQEKKHYPEVAPAPTATVQFVEKSRIDEIDNLPRGAYDSTKLSQLLVELNRAYNAHSYFSCQLLIRAIVDHVPPIFGQATFGEVANNYAGGGRSFRESMQHLHSSCRKLADGSLHTPIRAKESVPTAQQVEFRADVDALLGEVIRALRGNL